MTCREAARNEAREGDCTDLEFYIKHVFAPILLCFRGLVLFFLSQKHSKPTTRFCMVYKVTNEAKMEITLEAIISLIGIIVGGGSIGGFLFWKQTKRRAKAEASLAEAEAKKAEIEADKERQDYYQQLAKDLAEDREDRKRQNEELRAERDHYKESRDNYRDLAEKFETEMRKMRQMYEKEREQTNERMDQQDRKIARMGNQIAAMRPFQCGDLKCKKRVRVTIAECEEIEKTIRPEQQQEDIEPLNPGEL